MSNHRYSPEFKDEAVRQIIEAGHSVSDVAARLGVSTNSQVDKGNYNGRCTYNLRDCTDSFPVHL